MIDGDIFCALRANMAKRAGAPAEIEDDDDGHQFKVPITVRYTEKQIGALRKQARHLTVKVSTLIRMESLRNIEWEREGEEGEE